MNRNLRIAALMLGGVALVAGITWYGVTTKVEAACGASTSSCKTCHEIQGKDPVSKKGDWHVNHALGDFCEFCHGGVTKETDKDKAHQGMRKPLADPNQSCASCHPDDLAARVAKYGGTVAPGTGTAPASSGTDTSTAPSTPTASGDSSAPAPAPAPAASKQDVIDFNRPMPGEPQPANRTSQALWGLNILAFAGLAGVFVLERRGKSGRPTRHSAQPSFGDALVATLPPAHADLVQLLARCDESTLHALERVLRQDGGAAFIRRLAGLDLGLLDRIERMSQEELFLVLSLARGQKN